MLQFTPPIRVPDGPAAVALIAMSCKTTGCPLFGRSPCRQSGQGGAQNVENVLLQQFGPLVMQADPFPVCSVH